MLPQQQQLEQFLVQIKKRLRLHPKQRGGICLKWYYLACLHAFTCAVATPAIVRIRFPPPNITVMVFARESDSDRADVISLVVHQIIFFSPKAPVYRVHSTVTWCVSLTLLHPLSLLRLFCIGACLVSRIHNLQIDHFQPWHSLHTAIFPCLC